MIIQPHGTRNWLLSPNPQAYGGKVRTLYPASQQSRDSVCLGPRPGPLSQQLYPEDEDQQHGHLVLTLTFHLTGRWFKLSLAQCAGGGGERETKSNEQVDFIRLMAAPQYFLEKRFLAT